MQLLNISAQAHPTGNRIDLYWELLSSPPYPRVRVVRREGTYPTEPNPTSAKEGIVVSEQAGQNYARDEGLRGETVYYYALFPYKTSGPDDTIVIDNRAEQVDVHNRISTMATAPYNFAGQMYGLLPAIYHRYDTILPRNPPPDMPAEDRQGGQLLRFLELPGLQLDQLYSFARATLNFYDLDEIDGRLLPLLAQWIGWKTDHSLEISAQRNEIRFAPHLYKAIGLIPTVEATVKRVSGWESRTKEFLHNVARTNQPERLNLWSALRKGATWEAPALASVNWVYEVRPAVVKEADGSLSFFYHTYRRHGWDIWSKSYVPAVPDVSERWQPSQPVVDQRGIDKHPTAALQDDLLWLFWESYDPAQSAPDRKWRVHFRTRLGGDWSDVALFGDAASERRLPTATIDKNDKLWLFWLEWDGTTWQVKYNRHNGTDWESTTAVSLPQDDGQDRVEDDLFIFFANGQLWLFWARQDPDPGGPPGQTRWTIAYRIKQNLALNTSGWSQVRRLPNIGVDDSHDREPAPRLTSAGNIELFWGSNRSGNWSIWTSTLDINALTWDTPEQITTSDYSERAPLAIDAGTDTLLLYRSNESLEYTSTVYRATATLDARFAGTTTFDTRNTGKRGLRGLLEDFQTYTYDAGQDRVRTNDDRIARDTIGLYLKPDPDITDPDEIKAITSRLNNVLVEFMPITARAVFITA